MSRSLDLQSAALGALLGIVVYHFVRRRSEKEKQGKRCQENTESKCVIAGAQRATRHSYTLRSREGLPDLQLDISVAKTPSRHCNPDGPVVILYVLDPEPILFGAAALFAYGQVGYYPSDTTHSESVYRRMVVVGVGHCAEAFSGDSEGFDSAALRTVRRRDFPPQNHPAIIDDGRGPNVSAKRFIEGICDEVVPYVESELLGLTIKESPPRRALIGASYSGAFALQALIRRPKVFTDFILGSPSVCFDPEVLHDVEAGDWAGPAVQQGVGVIIILGKKERKGKAVLGNVHDEMTPGCRVLADKLRDRGLSVEGIHEVPLEDHGTVKMPLVSQGMTWWTDRVMGVARRRAGD